MPRGEPEIARHRLYAVSSYTTPWFNFLAERLIVCRGTINFLSNFYCERILRISPVFDMSAAPMSNFRLPQEIQEREGNCFQNVPLIKDGITILRGDACC